MTHLCTAIFVGSVERAKREIAAAVEAGTDMVELRIDEFANWADLSSLVSRLVPLIFTCRPVSEGGRSRLSEETRLALLREVSKFDDNYVDVELAAYQQMPEAMPEIPGKLILSAHDFQGRPDRLYNLVRAMNES